VKIIGKAGELETDIEALLISNNIFPRPFSYNALSCLPSCNNNTNKLIESSSGWIDSGWKMPSRELLNQSSSTRRDLRLNRRIFSVDPPGCQDIDDAMSMTWIEKGIIEVSVSIADVTAFVPQGCALDIEAQQRGTTIYLTHRRIDMLPGLLSSDIASLHGNKDRYAVTVNWKIKLTHRDGSDVTESEDPLELDLKGDINFEFIGGKNYYI
jgi:exoribonuclease R